MLVTQPSKLPTRKMWAVIIAAIFVNATIGTVDYFVPGIRESFPIVEWIDELAMVLSGYFVKERALT